MTTLQKLLNLEKSKKIGILGYGLENKQFLDWLLTVVKIQPEQVVVFDARPGLDLPAGISSQLGNDYLKGLLDQNLEMVFKAPGIWSLVPELVDFRSKHGQQSVLSPMLLFFERFRDNIIAVTGTKGKSTTANLTNHLLHKFGLESHYCGNTSGISPYTFWIELDQKPKDKQLFVVEVSSFQLQDLGYSQISPKYSILTNLYIDHLDQHKDIEEYWSAKDNIFLHQQSGDFLTINPQVIHRVPAGYLGYLKTFDKDLVTNLKNLKTGLKGEHNTHNLALTCLTLSNILKQPIDKNFLEEIKNNIQNFQTLPHRQELFKSVTSDDLTINFIDDGCATEAEAVVASIDTFTEQENEFVFIFIGGKDKQSNTGDLTTTIKNALKRGKIKRLVLFSEVGQKILNFEKLTNTYPDQIVFYKNLQEAWQKEIPSIDYLRTKFTPRSSGEKVLNVVLSPGGSSFDEFLNYTQRSNLFREYVESL